MPTLAQLAVFAPAALLVAASPGANNLLALRNGVQGGTRAAIVALRGRAAAFLVMVLLVAAGLGAVLARSQTLLEALRIAGAAYLSLLGVRALLGSGGADVGPARKGAGRRRFAPARQELVVAAANPKALLLFTAFVPQFVAAGRPIAPQLLVLGLLYIAIELAAACGWAYAGGRIGRAQLSARARRRLERGSGGVFVALAAALAADAR